VIFIANLTVL